MPRRIRIKKDIGESFMKRPLTYLERLELRIKSWSDERIRESIQDHQKVITSHQKSISFYKKLDRMFNKELELRKGDRIS